MSTIPPYYLNSSVTVCIHGLEEDCQPEGTPPVPDATITAQLFEADQVTPIGSAVSIPPVVGQDGDYRGVIPSTPAVTKAMENIYIKVIIDKSNLFHTEIYFPKRVTDRTEP